MTRQQWQASLYSFGVSRRLLLKQIEKLYKYQKKDTKKYALMLPSVQVEIACLRKIYELLDEQSYWHKHSVGIDKWSQFQESAESFFTTLDKCIPQKEVT